MCIGYLYYIFVNVRLSVCMFQGIGHTFATTELKIHTGAYFKHETVTSYVKVKKDLLYTNIFTLWHHQHDFPGNVNIQAESYFSTV